MDRKKTDLVEVRTLIVDDVELNLEMTEELLKDFGMQVDKASSGMEAIGYIKKNRYDIVFMDHMMPEMDGLETARKIREMAAESGNPYFAELPIIALTANATDEMKQKFLEAGMQDLVSKPIDIRQLNTVIRKWIPEEKIEEADPAKKSGTAETEDRWEKLPECIDTEIAKNYCTTYDLFLRNLKTYCRNFENTRDKLLTFRNEQNAGQYCVLVHGLKSTSKMLGLSKLSEMARIQEEYCNRGEGDRVWPKTDELLTLYGETIAKLREYLNLQGEREADNTPTDSISRDAYQALIDRIRKAAETFDMGEFMNLEEELEHIKVPTENQKQFEQIKEMIANVAFGDLTAFLKSL